MAACGSWAKRWRWWWPTAARPRWTRWSLITFETEDLPVSVEVAPGGPTIHPEAPGNHAFDWAIGDPEAVEASLAAAAHRVRLRVEHNRVIVNAMEGARRLGRMGWRAAASVRERAGGLDPEDRTGPDAPPARRRRARDNARCRWRLRHEVDDLPRICRHRTGRAPAWPPGPLGQRTDRGDADRQCRARPDRLGRIRL